MPISYRYKYKFIHIPKTGGSSIEKVFDLQKKENLFTAAMTKKIAGCWFAPQHFTHRMIHIYKPESRDWFSFTIVRNPYAKIVSEFFYINQNFYKNHFNKFNEDHFVEWFKKDLLKFDMDHKLPQYFFLDEPVDMILRFENLKKDFNRLTKHLNISKELIHDNQSIFNKEGIVNKLSLSTKELIYSNFQRDFESFGYKF